MYSLMAVCIFGLKTLRNAFPSLIPFIVADGGLNDAQRASLLSAFWAGYSTSPLLGAPVVQKYGGKGILTVAMAGTGGIFAVLPAASAGGIVPLTALICAIGLLQGPLSPAMSEMNRCWMPVGSERIWAQRAQGVAHHMTVVVAAFATPRLCATLGGWRFACRAYGFSSLAFTALWQLLARSRPPSLLSRPTTATEMNTHKNKDNAQTDTNEKAVEWGIFRVSATQATVLFYVLYGHLNFAMVHHHGLPPPHSYFYIHVHQV